jgi:hypothetical protein
MSKNMEGRRGPGEGNRESAAKRLCQKLTEVDLGGPIEDEETARKKLEEAGFSPDNVKETTLTLSLTTVSLERWFINPICCFAAAGDLKMCRYLVTKGASTVDIAKDCDITGGLFPMIAAAGNGRKDICEWLYMHGAHTHVSRVMQTSHNRTSPLQRALDPVLFFDKFVETAQWLLLHGAIPSDGDGNLNEQAMKSVFCITSFSGGEGVCVRDRLLKWAKSICSVRDNFFVFLCGTVHIPRLADGADPRPIGCLSGYEGIRKRIGDYVGVMTGRNLKTVRQIVEPLDTAVNWYHRQVAQISNARAVSSGPDYLNREA